MKNDPQTMFVSRLLEDACPGHASTLKASLPLGPVVARAKLVSISVRHAPVRTPDCHAWSDIESVPRQFPPADSPTVAQVQPLLSPEEVVKHFSIKPVYCEVGSIDMDTVIKRARNAAMDKLADNETAMQQHAEPDAAVSPYTNHSMKIGGSLHTRLMQCGVNRSTTMKLLWLAGRLRKTLILSKIIQSTRSDLPGCLRIPSFERMTWKPHLSSPNNFSTIYLESNRG